MIFMRTLLTDVVRFCQVSTTDLTVTSLCMGVLMKFMIDKQAQMQSVAVNDIHIPMMTFMTTNRVTRTNL